MREPEKRRGQITVEFALIFAGAMIPLTFGMIFTAQILWVWHSVNELTRMGASYAATHCWQSSAGNVTSFMLTNTGDAVSGPVYQWPGADPSQLFRGRPGHGDAHSLRVRRRLHFRLYSGCGDGEYNGFSITGFCGHRADRTSQFSNYDADPKLRLRSGAGSLSAVE